MHADYEDIPVLQFGICNTSDLMRAVRTRPGSSEYLERPCYIGLYDDVIAAKPDISGSIQEAILFSFTVSNGCFKRTSRNRFGDFDQATIETLRQVLPRQQHFVIHDMAVSDARTASDFFARLSSEFNGAFDFYASDLCLKVFALRKPNARTVVVVDERGNVLQLMFEPFVLPTRTRRPRWYHPINRVLRLILMHTSVKGTLRLHETGNGFLERREISLVCPEARETIRRYSNFHINTYDAFETAPRSYSIVRAMNLLNRSYFSGAALTTIIANIAISLEEGGVFITGSNAEAGSAVDGTIYRKRGRVFSPIHKSGNGSLVDDLIQSLH